MFRQADVTDVLAPFERTSSRAAPALARPRAFESPGGADGAAAAEIWITLSESVRRQVEDAAARLRTPESALFAAAWGLLLGRYSGVRSIALGVGSAARAEPDEAALPVDPTPVRLTWSDDEPASSLLRRLAEALAPGGTAVPFPRGAAPRDGIPTETSVVFEALTLRVVHARTLRAGLSYARERFDALRVRRALDHFEAFLRGVTAEATRIGALPLLRATERAAALEEGLGPRPFSAPLPSALDLIEEQVSRRPSAPALEMGDERWTYSALNASAEGWLAALVHAGVGPETRVAICLRRGASAIASILATWKAGAAYVALDPAADASHLEWTLGDSGATVLVADDEAVKRLPSFRGAVIHPSRVRQRRTAPAGARRTLHSDGLACLVYDSARSAGVLWTQRGLVHLREARRQVANTTARARVEHTAPIGSSASVWEIVLALTSGACLVCPAEAAASRSETVRPGERLSVLSWTNCVEGYPIDGARTLVLGTNLEPLPSGIVGELFLSGGGLARGYADRPGLTAARFLPNPFAKEHGERMYRTGHRARREDDGGLTLVGSWYAESDRVPRAPAVP